MSISQLRLFKSTMAHEKNDEGRFLFYANFTEEAGRKLREFMGKDSGEAAKMSIERIVENEFGAYFRADVSLRAPDGFVSPDYSAYYRDVEMARGSYIDGNGVLHVPGSMFHFTHYVSPLRNAHSIGEFEKFPFPSVKGFSSDHMAREVEEIHKAGRVASCWTGHMYEDAWQIRGYEEFLMDMAAEPENCEYILDRILERNLENAVAGAKAGVDLLVTGDDVANQRALMFSAEMWRRFMKPRFAKVYKTVKSINPNIKTWYHSDGNVEAIIPDLIEIGLDILNPVQPECMDVIGLKKKFGCQLVFEGTIGTQSTMPFGTPDDVRAAVRRMKKEVGYDGGLILAPTHVLEPEVPVENMLAFFDESSKSANRG